jgi:hypothetical protein
MDFLKHFPNQTYTSISKHFDIEMGTVRDLIKMYRTNLQVVKIGTALMVNIKNAK